jgi:serine/threonine protein kinase
MTFFSQVERSISNSSIAFNSVLSFSSLNEVPKDKLCVLCSDKFLVYSQDNPHNYTHEIKLTNETIIFSENSNEITVIQPNNSIFHLKSEESNLINEWIRKFTFCIFKEFSESSFANLSILGKGSYGSVYLSQKIDSGELIALKEIAYQDQDIFNQNQFDSIFSELNVLTKVHHPFIVQYIDSFLSSSCFYICLENIIGGNLLTTMKSQEIMNLNDIQIYIAEISIALNYLHSKKIIYQDLKPENILINSDGHIKLCDFGSSIDLSIRNIPQTRRGTVCYLAPDVFENQKYVTEMDLWALGILLYEMLFKVPPFFSMQENRMIEKIQKQRIVFPANVLFRQKIWFVDFWKEIHQNDFHTKMSKVIHFSKV